jgi:peptidoglycan/LPS O-acetylase OafA/YrhL
MRQTPEPRHRLDVPLQRASHRRDIDGLRGIAMLAVISFHLDLLLPSLGTPVAPGGFVGVDVFFVISGYLITRTIFHGIDEGTYSTVGFYGGRVRRIFPALLVLLACCIIAAFFINFSSQAAGIGRSIVASVFFVSNIMFYNSAGYFSRAMESNPLLHLWSLSVEVQFYVAFPILIFSLRKCSASTRVLALLAISTLDLVYSAWTVRIDPVGAFYLLSSRAWELLIGSLLAAGALPAITPGWPAESAGALGLALVVVSAAMISASTPFPGLAALAPCLGAAAVIHSGVATTTLTGRLLAAFPLRFIGLISYSLYLWHWPTFVFFRFFREPTDWERFAIAATCIVLVAVSWKVVEQPPRRKPYRTGAPGTLAAGGMAMAVVSLAAVLVGPANRAFWQLPTRAEDVMAYLNYDGAGMMREGRCFLSAASNDFALFKPDECLARDPGKGAFLVLGDSHAAHLWHGLRVTFPDVAFIQATASGCKPTVDTVGERRCTAMMKFIMDEFLPSARLDGVILAARWDSSDVQAAARTAAAILRHAPSIFVFGPIVEYTQPLPRVLARSLILADSHEAEFASGFRRNDQLRTDRIFAATLPHDGVKYVSVYHALCDPECVLWANESEPLQFDYGHLTRGGSMYLARRVGPQLFQADNRP